MAKHMPNRLIAAVAGALLIAGSWPSIAQDSAPRAPQAPQGEMPGPRHAQRTPGLPLSPSGGGNPGAGNVDLERLRGYDVLLKDGQEFGNLEGVLVNPESGRLSYAVITGRRGPLNIGAQRYDVPWTHVARVDTTARKLTLDLAASDFTADAGLSGSSTDGAGTKGPDEKKR